MMLQKYETEEHEKGHKGSHMWPAIPDSLSDIYRDGWPEALSHLSALLFHTA